MDFSFRRILGAQAASIVEPFYAREGSPIELRSDDLFFLAFAAQELVGSARYCVENGKPMLRTMRVARRFQGQGLGRRLLAEFASYLEENRVSGCYCLPLAHLEPFYAQIGFKPVPQLDTPVFLQERLGEYQRLGGGPFLCMVR